jgi:hypothetical protein
MWISILLAIIIFPFFAIGLFTVICLFKTRQWPMDKSNVFNIVRLWWFCLTRPHLFVSTFEWLGHDEYDNVKKKG